LDYEIHFDSPQRILLLAFHNDLTEASYLAGFSAAVAFVKANSPEGVIVDFSDIREFGLSSEFVRMIADLPDVIPKPRVVVAPQKEVSGMVRMYQLLRESNEVGFPTLVQSLDGAVGILGLDSLEFGPAPRATLHAGS
jgi:hypothetical protein